MEIRYIFVIALVLATQTSAHTSCGLYGEPPCIYVPAPPGQTPHCARPGTTFCEHVDNYPTYLIKQLLLKWGTEVKNLIIDESWDEFESLRHILNNPHHPNINHFYNPTYIFGYGSYNPNFKGYKYPVPQQASADNNLLLISNSQNQNTKVNVDANTASAPTNNGFSPHNPALWLRRYARDLSEKNNTSRFANSRDVSLNLDLYDLVGVKKERKKRQTPGRSTLCQTSTQFIMPQAALNSKGNWMFVVNEDKTVRQLVKTELCSSTECSDLCQLPNGYTSRCEQKYIQKRLIALHSSGENLYTDTFWFPSCCVCTIRDSF